MFLQTIFMLSAKTAHRIYMFLIGWIKLSVFIIFVKFIVIDSNALHIWYVYVSYEATYENKNCYFPKQIVLKSLCKIVASPSIKMTIKQLFFYIFI